MKFLNQRRSLFVVLAMVALIAAIWSSMLVNSTTHMTLDAHVQYIAAQLKCPICQGESVADSSVGLAQEMRGLIRQKLQAGESDQQIIQFFIDRYGEQILLSPPWWGFSLLAWLVPIGLLLGGAVLLALTLRDWRGATPMLATTPDRGNGTNVGDEETRVLADIDEDELGRYRVQLEAELVADDILFGPREVR